MKNYYKYRKKRKKPEIIPKWRIYDYIREKILIRFPCIYLEIIKDEYPENVTEFIILAVEEKFERNGIKYHPAEYDKAAWEEEIKEYA